MRLGIPASNKVRLLAAAALAVVASSPFEAPPAMAQVPSPTASAPVASASAPGSAGAKADPGKSGVPIDRYAWPTTPSPEPAEDEWAGATALPTVVLKMSADWWDHFVDVPCTQRAVREWVRVTCTSPESPKGDILFGVVWGVAGDLSSVKGAFTPAGSLPRYQKLEPNPMNDLTRKMGAVATVTFQVKQGSALLLSIGRIGWVSEYSGTFVSVSSGVLIDVSWALGEKTPTILYNDSR